jgi:hypothetical protein
MGYSVLAVNLSPSISMVEDLPYLEEFRQGQPELGTNVTWDMYHRPVQINLPHIYRRTGTRRQRAAQEGEAPVEEFEHNGMELYLCLFGVPGVHRGKANDSGKPMKAKTNTAAWAVEQTALNHVARVVKPAESNGANVFVFVHGWVANSDDISSIRSRYVGNESVANMSQSIDLEDAMRRSYGSRLAASRLEPFMHAHHLVSMVLSGSVFFKPLMAHAVVCTFNGNQAAFNEINLSGGN